ncbi:MAG: hypothetical protein AAF628_21405 [Planctomycetota bacterium]
MPLALAVIPAIAPAQCPPHIPAFPSSSDNWAPRLAPEAALIIRAQFATAPTTWPNQAEADLLITHIDTLAKNNAYNAPGYHIAFLRNGTLPYFDVVPTIPAPVRSPATLLDIIEQFKVQYPIVPIEAFDHVIVFRPPDPGNPGAPSNAAGYITYQTSFQPGPSYGDPMEEAAAGVFHEMGHKYGLGHANLLMVPSQRGTQYGDVHDYMGGVAPRQWRFDEFLWPLSGGPVFAAPTQIHTNPIVKLLHFWTGLAAFEEITAAGSQQYEISGISQPNGTLALEIPREEGPATPWSLLVYWRDNEPQVAGGASVAVVSRYNIRATTRLIERVPGPAISGRPGTFPAWRPTLLPFESWTDPVSGVTITCDGFHPITNNLLVTVDRPSPLEFENLGYVQVVAPALDSLKVQRATDSFCVAVNAAIYDGPWHLPWEYIAQAEGEIRVGEGANRRVLRVGSVNGPEARFDFNDPDEVWHVDVGSLVDPFLPSGPIQATATLGVTVYTEDDKRTRSQKAFLIDQTP